MEDQEKKAIFKPAPFAQEIFTVEGVKKFNQLPPNKRKFVEALVEFKGDLKKATEAAGIRESKRLKSQKTVKEALLTGGIDSHDVVDALKECLDARRYILDKHGEVREIVDLPLKLKTAELICKLMGSFNPEGQAPSINKDEELFQGISLDDASDSND